MAEIELLVWRTQPQDGRQICLVEDLQPHKRHETNDLLRRRDKSVHATTQCTPPPEYCSNFETPYLNQF
jgi:hypothetical protein